MMNGMNKPNPELLAVWRQMKMPELEEFLRVWKLLGTKERMIDSERSRFCELWESEHFTLSGMRTMIENH